MFEFLNVEIIPESGVLVSQILAIAIGIMIGVVVAVASKLVFKKKFASSMTVHAARNTERFLFYGIIIITILGVTLSQGVDLAGIVVAGGIFGVVIGFATQSVISNLVSGIFLLIEKPIKMGEVVQVQDSSVTGNVIDIALFSTKIQLFDGTLVRVPNSSIFTSELRTFSLSEIRRQEVTVGIAYDTDVNKAKQTILDSIWENMEYVLAEPGPQILVSELADSSVNLTIRVWHPKDDLMEVTPVLLQVIKEGLDKEGIEIPFPQRVVTSSEN